MSGLQLDLLVGPRIRHQLVHPHFSWTSFQKWTPPEPRKKTPLGPQVAADGPASGDSLTPTKGSRIAFRGNPSFWKLSIRAVQVDCRARLAGCGKTLTSIGLTLPGGLELSCLPSPRRVAKFVGRYRALFPLGDRGRVNACQFSQTSLASIVQRESAPSLQPRPVELTDKNTI
jgi:hypothetical protein